MPEDEQRSQFDFSEPLGSAPSQYRIDEMSAKDVVKRLRSSHANSPRDNTTSLVLFFTLAILTGIVSYLLITIAQTPRTSTVPNSSTSTSSTVGVMSPVSLASTKTSNEIIGDFFTVPITGSIQQYSLTKNPAVIDYLSGAKANLNSIIFSSDEANQMSGVEVYQIIIPSESNMTLESAKSSLMQTLGPNYVNQGDIKNNSGVVFVHLTAPKTTLLPEYFITNKNNALYIVKKYNQLPEYVDSVQAVISLITF